MFLSSKNQKKILMNKIKNIKDKDFGVIAGLFRSFLISLTAIISKKLIYYNPHEILFYRSIAALTFQLFYLEINKKTYSFRNLLRIDYALYGFLCCLCSGLFIYALKLNNFSEAMILCHTSPFFSIIIEIFYNRNKFVLKEIFYISLAFLGVIVIFSENFELSSSWKDFNVLNISFNHGICFLQAGFTAIRVEYEKKISHKNGEILLNFSSLFSYLIYGVVFSFFYGYFRIPDSFELQLLVVLGALIIISETLFIKSLKFEKASIMLMIQSSRMFMSLLLEVVLLRTYPNFNVFIGSIIIYLSIIYIKR